jgi:hypothetical protein
MACWARPERYFDYVVSGDERCTLMARSLLIIVDAIIIIILLHTWYMGKRAPIYRAGKAIALS